MKRQPPRWYVLDGERVVPASSMLEWAAWFEDANTRVDYTQITSDCSVSTIFIGFNHRYFSDGPPLVFETMIFGGPNDIENNQWRYSSWDDAETGHKAAVRIARAALKQKVGR